MTLPTPSPFRQRTHRSLRHQSQDRFWRYGNTTQLQAYNLTAGQINMVNADKKKSAGVLYRAAQLEPWQ